MGKNKNWFIESTVEAGEVVINDGGSSVDFRIEGDTDANLLVTDGSADKVGIGTNTPDTKLHITSDTVGELLAVSNHNVSNTMPSEMVLKKSRGSKIAPATIVDGDELGKISFDGYDGNNYDELAHITVKSTSVSSDTSSMTFHSDKFILDTGGLQFGTTGVAVNGIRDYATTSSALSSDASDTELVTAKAVYQSLTYASISSISWSGGAVANQIPRGNSSTTLTASNIFSSGASGSVSIGSDTTSADASAGTQFKVTGVTNLIGNVLVGVSGTGHDVTFYGDDANRNFFWDQSAMSLTLGSDDTGVDFIAHGATASDKLHWDESADTLYVYGDTELGRVSGDTIKITGSMKPASVATSVIVNSFSALQSSDVFIINDKNSAKAFFVEDDGIVKINKDLQFANEHSTSIRLGNLSAGDNGNITIFDYDADGAGGKSFILRENGVSRLNFNSSDALAINASTFTSTTTSETKFVTNKLKINGVSDSAGAGILEVSTVQTSTGNLVLDSSGGTVHIKDNLTVDGTVDVTGFNVSGTTSDVFMIDSDGKDLGFKAVDIADSSLPIAVSKWIHPINDAAGAVGTAGLAVQYIHSDNSMILSTKDAADSITLAAGYNHDSGDVKIGTSTSKQSNLICYGDATISGDLTVSGTLSGSFAATGTSSTTFQIDSAGSGPKLHVGSDDLLQTVNSDGSTLEQIHTEGILLDNVKGASTNMSFKSYNGYMKMQPGTNANTARYLWLEGSIKIRSMGALTYNYIGGSNKIGSESHGSFGTTDDLSAGDTIVYTDGGKLTFDASANIANFTSMDLIFGATSLGGAGATDNQEVKFYGNNTSAYTQWSQANNKLLVVGTAVGTTNFQVHTGKAIFGRDGVDSLDVEFFGAAGEVAKFDAGDSVLTLSQGLKKKPNVKAATVTLTKQESGRAIVVKNKTADAVYTLPAAADGLNYKFMIVEKTGSFDVEIKSPSATNFFFGGVTHLDTDSGSGGDEIVTVVSDNDSNDFLTLTLVEAGSMVEMYCDGTNWFVTGHVSSATAPAFGDVSGL